MSTAQALFTQPQSKVLKWVFGQPERWNHILELIRLTSLASASLQREVKRLHVAGLVVEERIANLRRVKADPASPMFADLANRVCKTMGAVPGIADALQPLASRLLLALVFDSVGKGTELAGSDVDVLLVSGSVQLSEALGLLPPLAQQLERRIEVKLYTSDEFDARCMQAGSVVQRIFAGPVVAI